MLDYAEEGIKVIVVGDGNVGKTCMLRRFVKGDFIEQYRKTIGAEFMEKDVFLRSSNTTVKLMLWDTAGQEVFNALTQAYYRGAGAAVLAFSTVDRDSFMNIAGWKQRVESVCGPITMVLCQTKFDLSHEAVITNEEAERLASQLEVPLFRVSTKDDFNVTQLFEFTAQQCVENAAQEAADKEEAEDEDGTEGVAGNATGSGTEPAAEASASPAVEPEPHGEQGSSSNGGARAAAPPAGASASPPNPAAAAPAPQAPGPGAPGKAKHKGGRGKARATDAPNKVSLAEAEVSPSHKKKRVKCSLA